jgi:predicted transcriptional regulator
MEKSELILENDTRRLIYNHITTNPGVSFIVLKNIFNLNESTLRYHLDYLEKNNKIIFGFESGKRNYYPHFDKINELKDPENTNSFQTAKLTDYQERIISTIKLFPKINQKELAKRTGINRITLHNNLKKLMSLCMIRKIPNGNKVHYEYIDNKKLRVEILKQLLVKLINNEIDGETFLELKKKLD